MLNLRGVIGQAIEGARQEKLIGNALEAAVTLTCDEAAVTADPERGARRVFYPERAEASAREGAGRDDFQNHPSKMRALLAASADGGKKRGASGIVRSVRERRQRTEQLRRVDRVNTDETRIGEVR